MIKGPVKQHPMWPDWVIDAEGATVCKARAPEEAVEILTALNAQAEQAARIKELEKECGLLMEGLDEYCPDCQPSGECEPCYGISCPHWAQCFPQFRGDVKALDEKNKQTTARIAELERACEVVIRNIDADAVTAGWASNYLKKWLGKEHPTTNNQSKANAKGEPNHGD